MARVIRRNVVEQDRPIGVNNFDTDADAVGLAIQRAGETLREKAFKIDAKKAEKAGEEAALAAESDQFRAFDEDGKPVAMKAPEGFGSIAKDAYQRVAERRFVETMDQDIRLKSQELAVKYDRNPIGYQRAMDSYLEGLGKNSDGRFREFVVNAGKAVSESTFFQITARERNRLRQKNAQAIIASNIEHEETAALLTVQGDTAAGMAIAFERRDATKEGESAELNVGSGDATFDSISGTVIGSHFAREINNLDLNATESFELISMIESYGTANVSKRVTDIYNATVEVTVNGEKKSLKLRDYINPSNHKVILSTTTGVASAKNRIAEAKYTAANRERIEQERIRQEAERRRLEDERDQNARVDLKIEGFKDDIFTSRTDEYQTVIDAFGSDGNVFQALSVAAAEMQRFDERLETLANEDDGDKFGPEQAEALRLQKLNAILGHYVTQGAQLGNPDTFQAAIAGGLQSEAYKQLTNPKQQQVVQAIHANYRDLFDTRVLRDLAPLFSMSSSDRVERIRQDKINYQVKSDSMSLRNEIYNGTADEAAMNERISDLEKMREAGDINGDQFLANKAILKTAFGQRNARSAATHLNAFETDLLAQFIRSGDDFTGLEGMDEQTVDKVKAAMDSLDLSDMSPQQRREIAQELSPISTLKAQHERELEEDRKKQLAMFQYANGTMDLQSQEAQDISQELLDNMGFKIDDRNTWTEESISILSRSLGSDVVNVLENFANGNATTASPDTIMELVGRLSNFTKTGNPADGVNLLNGQINDNDMSVLLAIQGGIASGAYASIDEVVLRMNQAKGDGPQAIKDRVDATFVSKEDSTKILAPSKWVNGSGVLDGKGDFIVNKELGNVAYHMAVVGIKPDVIAQTIKDMFENKYKEAKYVVDPSRPIGMSGQSRHALGAIYSDPEMVTHLERQMNEALMEMGLTLYDPHKDLSYNQAQTRLRSGSAGEPIEGYEFAVLVPMYPYAKTQQDQVFAVMKIVDMGGPIPEMIPATRTVDGKTQHIGFNLSEEAKNYTDATMEGVVKKSMEELTEQFNMIEIVRDMVFFGGKGN